MKSGWQKFVGSPVLKSFFNKRNEINIEKNVLMWSNKVILPTPLQKPILKELHDTHMGIVKMKSLDRSYVWWPSWSADIEQISKYCFICQSVQKNLKKAALQSWSIPTVVWDKIHIDFLGPIKGKHGLFITDALSKWCEVCVMNSITTTVTIDRLRELFSRFGLPKVNVSGNGAQFTSNEFQEFVKENGIVHCIPPPLHPQSNGGAENSIRTNF